MAPVWTVAVHGYLDNHTVWDGVVDELAERFRAVTHDAGLPRALARREINL